MGNNNITTLPAVTFNIFRVTTGHRSHKALGNIYQIGICRFESLTYRSRTGFEPQADGAALLKRHYRYLSSDHVS